MSYCTQADILEQLDEDVLVQLTDDDDIGVVDGDVVTRAIADADAEIDSYCGTRHDLPFSPVPVMVRKLSVDLSIYNLYARRRGVSEDRQKRYDNAIRFLQDVARGRITLGADAPTPDSDGGPEATTTKSDRVFSMGRSSDGSTGTLDNF
jgi:phage gp36-like protein